MAVENSSVHMSRLRRWLMVAIAMFVLATGAFGALWFIERDNHRNTADQISAADAALKEAETDLKSAQIRLDDNNRLIPQLREQGRKARAQADADTDCAKAGRAIWEATDRAALLAARALLTEFCR